MIKKETQAMFEWILMTYYQIRDAFDEGRLKGLIRTRVFWQRLATPVEMELSVLPAYSVFEGSNYQFVELTRVSLETGNWSFARPSRRFKVRGNLRKGWRLFILVSGSQIVGDVWCIAQHAGENPIFHPDLKIFEIPCMEGEAYAFDMFIDPAFRGKNLAVPLQRSLHSFLKKEGFRKLYGYYWDDNRPALWMHRMLKFNELPKRQVSRFFFLHTTRILDQDQNLSKGTKRFASTVTKEKL